MRVPDLVSSGVSKSRITDRLTLGADLNILGAANRSSPVAMSGMASYLRFF